MDEQRRKYTGEIKNIKYVMQYSESEIEKIAAAFLLVAQGQVITDINNNFNWEVFGIQQALLHGRGSVN